MLSEEFHDWLPQKVKCSINAVPMDCSAVEPCSFPTGTKAHSGNSLFPVPPWNEMYMVNEVYLDNAGLSHVLQFKGTQFGLMVSRPAMQTQCWFWITQPRHPMVGLSTRNRLSLQGQESPQVVILISSSIRLAGQV